MHTIPSTVRQGDLGWRALPRVAQLYVALVSAAGAAVVAVTFPVTYPRPLLFAVVLVTACVTAAWKVNLPIPLASGSTLSLSCAANLMALLLLGPRHAVIIAVSGSLVQCAYRARQRYPAYRTAFSMMAEALAIAATGLVFVWLGGSSASVGIVALAKPLVGAIAVYFMLATVLVAGAVASSTNRSIVDVWRHDFLWSGVTFMVAGTIGALAAVVVEHGYHWIALLLLAPLYLTYRTYLLFIGRLEEMTQLEAVRKELLDREHAARASAEEANRLKDQFLAVVSHELRTPLNAILGWSDMLVGGKLDETRRGRAFTAIHDSAERQAQLIDELLDVARIMSGKLRLERTFVDVGDVVRGALNVVQPTADAKRIRIRVTLDSSIGVIYADRSRLQQVAWNLLSNAIKFTPEGGAVHMQLLRAADTVEMSVTDTGEGISDEFLTSMFEPFRQADGSTTRRHGGLGLGLSIVKHLVEAHGGVVTARSGGEGRGTTLTVQLPLAPASGAEAEIAMASHPRSTRPIPPGALEGLSVLVVDDDEQGRQVVAAQLEAHQAVVLVAASAAEALETLQREHVDVLLADIAMPEQDGYDLIRKLRALHPSSIAAIPAAALTAFARKEDRLQALRAGYQLHLAKPVDAQTLVMAVARLGGKSLDWPQPPSTPFNESFAVH